VLQIGQLGNHALMQRHTTRLPIFGVQEHHTCAVQVDMAPIYPKGLADAGTGVEQEHK
jgi:hypothetical protein